MATRRRFMAPKPRARRADLSGRNVIVTGCAFNSIGYQVAKVLAAWGADVVVTSLGDVEDLQQALSDELGQHGSAAGGVTAQSMDLSDSASVIRFADWYRGHHSDELHVLVNNAGLFRDIAKRSVSPILASDGEEIHWRVNFLGTFHLTNSLLPLLQRTGQRTGDARVIITSSVVHEKGSNDRFFAEAPGRYDSWESYAQSKLALVHFAFEIQRRFATEHGLHSAAVHPGDVRSNLTLSGLDDQPMLKVVFRLGKPLMAPFFLSQFDGAQTTIACASAVPFRGGEYYEACTISQPSPEAMDTETARRLWDDAEEWVAGLGSS